MLGPAREKARAAGLDVAFEVADAMAMPYPDASFDVSSISFGIRNVDDPVQCLREMARVVKPGGQVLVLEFGQPRGPWGALYRFYSRVVMPIVGGLLTGNRSAYQYLPRTAAAFPAGERFVEVMDARARFGTLGACLHRRHHLAVPRRGRGLMRGGPQRGRRRVSMDSSDCSAPWADGP
jgi:demethylmenaquinone methyltransferase/2-methoxy-6-polyprenyl-1,4-benzoquinol methylase